MKFSAFQMVFICLLMMATAPVAHAGDSALSNVAFNERGVIVDVHSFFTALGESPSEASLAHESVASKALVTADGVYSFLETPGNEKMLANTGNGSVVQVQGRLLRQGALLQVDVLEHKTQVQLIDFASYRTDKVQKVELNGENRCQCALDVGDLLHSCQLGHLHHLQTPDGKIYHYLQFAAGQDYFLGRGSHNRPVSVRPAFFQATTWWFVNSSRLPA